MNKDIPVFELFPNGSLNFIAMVNDPAMEELFIKFSKEEQPIDVKLSNEEKHVVTGPALIPNKKIIRYNKKTYKPFYVFFSEDTIEEVSQTFLRDNKNYNWDLEHDGEKASDIFITESWLVEDSENDKANALGFSVPKGTWMVSAKVNNADVWNKIKSGELRGFSIEGPFLPYTVEEEDYDALLSQVKNILSQDDNL